MARSSRSSAAHALGSGGWFGRGLQRRAGQRRAAHRRAATAATAKPRTGHVPTALAFAAHASGTSVKPLDDALWRRLVERARAVSANAWCPYSRFAVGAAVCTADGQVFGGCNVENASYGLTVCAERNAMFQAVAAGARELVALALFTPTPKPVTPCGACRQVMAELGVREIRCVAQDGGEARYLLAELLPHTFTLAP